MGSTTGTLLISYDLNAGHVAVKAAMKKKEYKELRSPLGQLPNTTLWHATKSSSQAISDIKEASKSAGVILEKAVAVLAAEFDGYNKP